jgi:hypothetical protein
MGERDLRVHVGIDYVRTLAADHRRRHGRWAPRRAAW